MNSRPSFHPFRQALNHKTEARAFATRAYGASISTIFLPMAVPLRNWLSPLWFQ